MPWTPLLDLRVMLGIALLAAGAYGAVQRIEKEKVKAEFAQFRADVETEAAKAKVRNAQIAVQQAQAAQEVLGDLQTRLDRANAVYASLRASASRRTVPALPSTPPSPSPVAGSLEQPYADARCMAALEWGDREMSKYAELWRLEQKNALQVP